MPRKAIKGKVDVVTMGCSKNLVDSERILSLFSQNGYRVAHDPQHAAGDIVVINTCGFIGDAKEESINMILQSVAGKKSGFLKKVYVMGCLSERYSKDLLAEIPEIDGIYGKFDWKNLLTDLDANNIVTDTPGRIITTPKHFAYFKISEGCNRTCAFCAIPKMTGHHRSRPMAELVAEATLLAKQGVKELQVIAQDLSYYGVDIDRNQQLAELIRRLSDIEGIEWIRLHYAYPAHFPYEILEVMRERSNVCSYLDIALQHISDPMLKAMRRNINGAMTRELLQKIRSEVPGIHLRTTLMVGFPGETESDFEELMRFVAESRFERMGAFTYSNEDGTYAGDKYTDDVPEEVKADRLDRLMALQQSISAEINRAKIGSTLKVIIDREEDGQYFGRTEFDSPEVDPEVIVDSEVPLEVGSFYMVEITDADEYDLFGTV